MNTARQYAFNLPWPAVAIGVLFYAGLSALMVHWARNFEGVVFVCLMILSLLFAILAVVMLGRRRVFPHVLKLTDNAVLFPHGFPRTRIARIAYEGIIRVCVCGEDSLRVATAKGTFEIPKSYLPGIKSFRAVRDIICSQASILPPGHAERSPSFWYEFRELPDPILDWVEPEDWPCYCTRLFTSQPLLLRLVKSLWFFVRSFAIVMVPWLLLRLLGVPTIPITVYGGLAIAVALFFTAIQWLYAHYPVHPTKISFRDKGITQYFGKQDWDLTYRDIVGWNVIERQHEERVLYILLLKLRTTRALALPDINTRDQAVQILQEKRVPQLPDLQPWWESRR